MHNLAIEKLIFDSSGSSDTGKLNDYLKAAGDQADEQTICTISGGWGFVWGECLSSCFLVHFFSSSTGSRRLI